jgi:hypothetical protein
MPVGGFRSFANDINSKAATSSVMPTFENFKKNAKVDRSASKGPVKRMESEADLSRTDRK